MKTEHEQHETLEEEKMADKDENDQPGEENMEIADGEEEGEESDENEGNADPQIQQLELKVCDCLDFLA